MVTVASADDHLAEKEQSADAEATSYVIRPMTSRTRDQVKDLKTDDVLKN